MNFLNSLLTTAKVGFLNAVISTVLGFTVAYAMNRHSFAFKKTLLSFFNVTLFFPVISMFIGVHIMMLRLDIANTLISVVISHLFLSLPYSINIGIAFFDGFSKNYEHISKILGASPFYTFRKVVFPQLIGGLSFSASIAFLISSSEYFATFLIGGGNVRTISGDMYPYIASFDTKNTGILISLFLLLNGIFFALFHIKRSKTKNLY